VAVFFVTRGYLGGLGGSTDVGTCEGSLIGDSGAVGVTWPPASFTALKVVPGGVIGGRLSTIRLVWSTRIIVAIEMAATITAINAGFRKALSIRTNASVSAEFRYANSSAPPCVRRIRTFTE
jgi:hypothetical protein